MAGSSAIGTTITFDREAADLSDPKDIKFELNASHTFDNEVVLGASVDYSNAASSDSATDNLEGTIGYRLRIHDAFLIIGSAGIGERFQTSGLGDDFPYYVFRVGADLAIDKVVTWNALSFRYRDAFDPSDDYLTPQLGTGLTFKVGQHGLDLRQSSVQLEGLGSRQRWLCAWVQAFVLTPHPLRETLTAHPRSQPLDAPEQTPSRLKTPCENMVWIRGGYLTGSDGHEADEVPAQFE